MNIGKRFRCRHHGSGGAVSSWKVRRIVGKLKLDAVQQSKLNAVQETVGRMRARVAESRRRRDAIIDELLTEKKFNREKAQSAITTHYDDVDANSELILDVVGEFYNSLSVPQREKLGELWQRRQLRIRRCWH
jgi:Spy/CpxP family protein refolding chaperone